jgi:sensor domain CHASE-containing protein
MLTLIALVFIAISYFVLKSYVLPTFKELEETESLNDISLCKTLIEDEIENIRILGVDWASWDDSYNFIQDVNKEHFLKSCLPETILDETKLDLIMFHAAFKSQVQLFNKI